MVQLFESQASLESYVTSRDYGRDGGAKVAAAIVFNAVDQAAASWDYSIRVNYTQNFESKDASVGKERWSGLSD